MKIIILAAGIGKRMWPITIDKSLLPFLGQPVFYHTLKRIKDAINFDEAIIVTREESKEQISKIASDLGVNFKIAVQTSAKGMADAVLSAKEYLTGEILVMNAEDILDENAYQDMLDSAAETQADVVLVGKPVSEYIPGGYLKVEGDKVKEVVEKPGADNMPSDLFKVVLDYFKDGQQIVSVLEKSSSDQDDVYEVSLNKMISDGLDVRYTKYEGVCIPIKYPWHVLDFTNYFLANLKKQISPTAKIAESAIIEGEVVIEDGVKVFEGAVIKGPCYIGKNCVVGNNSMVRESILEEGCVTGFNSDITRSYIGANSWFHTNYIGDSVIEGDFGMGSGAVLANLRLDNHTIRVGDLSTGSGQVDSGRDKLGLIAGKGSRVGVNASTMPGARIGSNALVGPGVVLYGDVKENKKVLVKQNLEITEHTPALTSYDQFKEKLK